MHAPSVATDRKKYWVDLNQDSPSSGTPWLVAGDLNEVLSGSEKWGGRIVNSSQAQEYKNWMNANGLIDLGYQGQDFTWTNGREGNDLIKERLDRALANAEWLDVFPNSKVIHLPRTFSDHCPILVIFEDHPSSGAFPFRCKEAWVYHQDFKNVIMKAWENTNISSFLEARDAFVCNVKNWNKYTFGRVDLKKKRLLARLGGDSVCSC